MRVLSGIPDVTVTVVDSDHTRLAEAVARYPSVRAASRLCDVLDDVEAVVIATPPTSHFAVANEALCAGKHVMVEKPLATSVHDAASLVATAARGGQVFMVAHTSSTTRPSADSGRSSGPGCSVGCCTSTRPG